MAPSPPRKHRLFALLPKPTTLFAALAFGVMLVAGFYVSWLNSVLYQQQSRNMVLRELSVVRAKLEGNINANLQLVRGLAATIATEPAIDQAHFAKLAAKLFEENSQLRNIAAAPGLVVRMMYPLKGNEKALGLDYLATPSQRDGAVKARDTGALVLAGPVDLVQGGRGFIGRFPVFTGGDGVAPRRFWGLVSAVVDADRLYAASGLDDPDLNLDIAIAGRDGAGAMGPQFYGPAEIFEGNPVSADAILPSGSWRVAAIPKGGWRTTSPNAWLVWALFLTMGTILAVPILLAGRLSEERQANQRARLGREMELAKLSRRLELALETSQVGVFEFDLDSGELIWDQRINALFGLPLDGGVRDYTHWRDALHPDDLGRAEAEFRQAIEVSGNYHSEYRIITPWGLTRNVRAIGSLYQDLGSARKIVGVNWDVSADVALNQNLKQANGLLEARNAELEAAKQSIEFNSLHDPLTGLPNRRFLDERLEQLAARAIAGNLSLSLLHIDLDRFKQINDTLGHAAGDAMLIHAAQVLKANLREEDFVARFGGDEFVVVALSDGAEAPLAQLANRIIAEMRRPVMFEGHECRFGVSVGIATEAAPAVDPKRLLIDADIALYRAKRRGRNRYEFFTLAMHAEAAHAKRTADEILQGLEQGQFCAYFQPQVDAHSFEVVGVEALARWRHPTEGVLAPARFLDVAEELSVVPAIDRIVLEEALRQFARWEAMGLNVPRVSVNVSARRLLDEQLIEDLKDLMFRPGTLSFELVESIFLDETDELMLWNIEQIKELGIDIEIDDFGTGYASIISLLKLRPRRLKIDRQLVDPIVSEPAQRQLVRSIVENGRMLGIEVIGEGVESMEHAALLRDMGCAALQGYVFSKPLSPEDLLDYLREGVRAAPRRAGA